MTEHLPECPAVQFYKLTGVCICDRLRACEQRVRDEPFGDSGKALLDKRYVAGREDERRALFDDEGPYTAGFNTGLSAARYAVDFLRRHPDPHTERVWVPLDEALAAIDALGVPGE